MKMFGKLLIAAGVLAIFGAAGSDEAYGIAYPLSELVTTVLAGMAMIVTGAAIHRVRGWK